ncbi:MAG: hypothetical protein VXV96_03285 [Bdellovibrionota bacterium]|nr:hypothetical protein [Bdellovibrionota bacterium]
MEIITLIAMGCTLIVFGIQRLSGHLLEILEKPLFHLFKEGENGHSFFKGILVSGLTGSTLTSVSTLLGLVNAGLVRVGAGLRFMAGAHIGPLALLFLLNLITFKGATLFMACALVVYILKRGIKPALFQKFLGVFLGLGLVGLGRHFLFEALLSHPALDAHFLSTLTDAPFLLSLLTGVTLGGVLCYALRSSMVTMLILIILSDATSLNPSLLLQVVIGVHTLNFLPNYRLGLRGNTFAARVAGGQMMVGVLGLIIGSLLLFFFEDFFSGSKGLSLMIFFFVVRSSSVLFFILFLRPLRRFLQRRWPRGEEKSPFELENLGRTQDMVPVMSLVQSAIHLNKLKNIVDRLFSLTEDYLCDSEASGRIMAKIKHYERITDNMNKEVRLYLGQLMENSLSPMQANTVTAHLRIADSLENIADYVDKVASYHTRYLQGGAPGNWRQEFVGFYRQVRDFYTLVAQDLPGQGDRDEKMIRIQAQKLKIAAEALREEHMGRFEEFSQDPMNLMTYSDMIVCMRKMRGHTLKLHQRLLP